MSVSRNYSLTAQSATAQATTHGAISDGPITDDYVDASLLPNWTRGALRVILFGWVRLYMRARRLRAFSIRFCSLTTTTAIRSRSWSLPVSITIFGALPSSGILRDLRLARLF